MSIPNNHYDRPLPEQFSYELRKQIEHITHDYHVLLPRLCAALLEIEPIAVDQTLTEAERVNQILEIRDKYGIK